MNNRLSRRDFLKLSGFSLTGLVIGPMMPNGPGSFTPGKMAGRVTKRLVPVYELPDNTSRILRKTDRDELINIQEELNFSKGAAIYPCWYRLEDGFIHSAYIQRYDTAHFNLPQDNVSINGQLGEVTVPYTQAVYKNRNGNWVPIYRLYYQSVHWIIGVMESPEGRIWYRLVDEWLRVVYCAPAEHIYLIPATELTPILADVPADQKRIEVSLKDQTLWAYEGKQVVLKTKISSGIRYMETPKGDFQIERKHPSKHMGDGGITSDLRAYELPGVPWVTFFHPSGIAFHGTYWHDNFGTPMSHGCVNMRSEDARWLFRWCNPIFDPEIRDRAGWKVDGKGTAVRIY